MIHKGNWWLAVSSWQCACSCITSSTVLGQNIKSPRWLSPHYSPDLTPCSFWLFPKLKSPLKRKRFQIIDEIQENTTGQLMAIGRTAWGSKVPTLKGTEASLSYVQCFLYLVSSSINVSFSQYLAGHLLNRLHMYILWNVYNKFSEYPSPYRVTSFPCDENF